MRDKGQRGTYSERPNLSQLLVDETIRRWLPASEVAASGIKLTIPKPQTDDELREVIQRYLGVHIPDQPVTPGRSTPFAALAEAYFARSPVSVWKGARALAGKTFTLAVLSWLEAVTLRANVSLLGGSQDQSDLVHDYMRTFWRRPTVPPAILASEPGTSKTRLIWGNSIKALAASQTKARGGHPPRLRIDEADELDLTVYKAIMGQPMTQGDVVDQVVISSTLQYPDKTMQFVLNEAAEKGWPVHEWGYEETRQPHGWLTQEQIERKRLQMTADSWRVEVELGDPSPEGRAIDPEKVERMFMGPVLTSPVRHEVPYREYEAPRAHASYATGGDWARSRDFVEIVTLRDDVFPLRLVAYQRFRKRAAPYIVAAFDHQTERYPGTASHDATSLGGKLMQDLLTEEGSGDTSIEGYEMTGRRRQNLFTDYILAIEHEEIVSPRIDVLYRQHKFVRNDDLRPGGTGHPPDGFVAGAMAYHASAAATQPLRLLNADTPERHQTEQPTDRLLKFLGPRQGVERFGIPRKFEPK